MKKSEFAGKSFPVVCLGGSAGSLAPLRKVIREIPADSGLAIVVVNHRRRAPTRLPEILASQSALPVELIASGRVIQPNRIYVIPPKCDLTMRNGAFHLGSLSKGHGWPNVVTLFLESLAREWRGEVIAVILSGLDSDGSRALQSVKDMGGITFAQKIGTAEHADMPQNALLTGCIDFELTPSEIGRELAKIGQSQRSRRRSQHA
jgi:chemotaxis response regulator CheB